MDPHTYMRESTTDQVSIVELCRRLTEDGFRLFEAEVNLARLESSLLVRAYLICAALIIGGIFLAAIAVIVLVQGGIVVLLPYVSHPALAYLSMAIALFMLAALCVIAGRIIRSRRHQPVGIVARTLWGNGKTE
jgi:Putative Actinobacterial Holin-X, holin superfamily III